MPMVNRSTDVLMNISANLSQNLLLNILPLIVITDTEPVIAVIINNNIVNNQVVYFIFCIGILLIVLLFLFLAILLIADIIDTKIEILNSIQIVIIIISVNPNIIGLLLSSMLELNKME